MRKVRPAIVSHIIHEQRFGQKNQIEVDVPLNFQDQNHSWYGGVGDTTLGVKRVMYSNLQSGSILSLFGGVIVPTGSRQRGFGSGTTTFETFAAFDQLFPTKTFVQTQLGADLPRHTDIAPQSIFFNTAIGQMLAAAARLRPPVDSHDGISCRPRSHRPRQNRLGRSATNAGNHQQTATCSRRSRIAHPGHQYSRTAKTSCVLPAVGLV